MVRGDDLPEINAELQNLPGCMLCSFVCHAEEDPPEVDVSMFKIDLTRTDVVKHRQRRLNGHSQSS